MKLAVSAFAAAFALASQVACVAGAVVYWQDHVESGDFVVQSGDMLVLRGNNSVDGLLLVSAGAQLVVDPAFDSYLRVGSIDVSGGTFRVGARDKPYTKKAVFELACDSPFLAADIRRKAVVVRENSTLALFGAKGVQQSWTRLRETAQAGESCLALDLPSGWGVGDEIVIPSTDFDPHQAEKRTIVGVTPSCVEIDRPLRFMHYGRVTEGVDERAEVGLLTRNIAFRACQEDGDGTTSDASAEVGGHMIFLENFRTVQVEGVELHNFGQGDELGRYPLHFHLCGRVPRDTFLRANAIHGSNFRAITLHGTQGVVLERNVAFNVTGHAIMLEDGAETDNVVRENLVVLVREKLTHARLGSDAQVALSAFYITNPDNTITDNVAAGVEGAAFWLDTRLEVKGLSYLTGKYAGVHPFKVALGDMRRNAAHSVEVGFKFDSPNLDMLDYPQQTYSPPYMYTPAEMPMVSEFRVHHSRQGGWFRSYRIVLDQWVVGDVTEGIQILSRGDTSTEPVETYVTNSLFVGGTANRGNLVASRWQFVNYLENRSDSAVERADDARMAIKLYDGPMYISNSTFRLWYSQPCLNVTNPALGTRAFNTFLMSTAIVANDVVFEQTDVKFFVTDREADGGRSTSMVDKLGAVSGRAGATLLPVWDLYMAPNCARSAAFGLACPQRYVNLDVINVDTSVDPTYYGKMRVHRNNIESITAKPPSLGFSGQYIPASSGWLYHPIVSPGASYALQFERRTPAQLRLRFSYTTAGDVFRLAVAYPAGSVVNSVVDQDGKALRQAASLGDASACVNCFFFDAAKGLLAIAVQERAGPEAPSASCAPQGCLTVEIKASTASASSLGVSNAQMGAILPFVVVTDDRSNWRRQKFPFESAGFDRATNMDWCKVRDPCLDAMDEGNVKRGVLAYSESPCVGVGCFSNTCRYCKLSFSAAKVPFPGCPYDPNYVAPAPSAAGVCAEFASVGNSAAGVEVIQDASCVNGGGVAGQGCINDACRFCKTRDTTQSANFLSCSSFTSTVAAVSSSSVSPSTSVVAPTPSTVSTTSVCSQYASVGNSAAGVEVIQDASCVNGGGVNGRGCINDACRYCKTRDTTQSANFLSCASFSWFTASVTTTSSAAATSAPTTAPVPANSVAPSTCPRLVAQGDVDAGISAQPDASCQFGGLGCFSLQCRYCKTRDTRQSSQFVACSQTTAATTATATTTAVTTTTSTAAVTTVDSCWQFVSPGDAAAGLAAVSDASCQRGGLGCLSSQCRFCSVRVTTLSSAYLPCDTVTSTPPTTSPSSAPAPAVAMPAAAAPDPCSSLVSSGDVAAGITAVTQPSCGKVGGVGCVTDTCRYCKTRTTSQSAHLLDCSQLVSPSSSSLQDASTASHEVVSSIDTCSHAVSIEENVMGIFGLTDARCGETGASAPAGCFTASCRHCRTEDATLTHNDESLQALEVCARFVVASTIGDTSPIRKNPTAPISSDECEAGISFGGAQLGISAFADTTCTAGSADDHSRGCFARAPCRFCQYRATPLSAGLPSCAASTSDDDDDDAAAAPPLSPPPCSMLPAALALPANVSAVDEPRCNTEAATLRGCVAFTSCRACTTDSALAAALDLPHCDALVDDAGLVAVHARLASGLAPADTEAAHHPPAPSTWSPIILAVVGAACAVAAATIVAHRRRRDRDAGDGVRTATPRSLPRASQSGDRVDVATLSHTSDIGADFFVL